jgi:hypothetical protein
LTDFGIDGLMDFRIVDSAAGGRDHKQIPFATLRTAFAPLLSRLRDQNDNNPKMSS